MPVYQSKWREAGCGPYPVTVIPNYTLTLSDGTKISLKIWYPARNLQGTGLEGNGQYLEWDPQIEEDTKNNKSGPSDDPISPTGQPLPAIFEYLTCRYNL